MKYSMDTSALLEGWRRSYPPAIFPKLWDGLARLIAEGHLRATEEVLHELERKDDEVHDWARGQEGFFVPIDEPIQLAVTEILRDHPKLLDTRKGRSGADPFVIALAKVEDSVVVPNERKTGSRKKPNIPDVCEAHAIPWMDLLGLIRELGWVFG